MLVPATTAKLLLKRSFWPKPVYARKWVYKGQSTTSKGARESATTSSGETKSVESNSSESSKRSETTLEAGSTDFILALSPDSQ